VIWGVLQFPGSCDERDALHACRVATDELAGIWSDDSTGEGGAGGASSPARNAGGTFPVAPGRTRLVWHEETDLSGFDGIVVPGGFSYGDYLRAGAIARFSPAMAAVAEFARAGGPVLGICNGFQVLCESGLLPGALLTNESTRFICRPGELVVGESDSVWLDELEPGERISIPFKHQSGRFFAPPEMLERIEGNRQVAFRYAEGQNPNGSLNDIAGVTNEAGNVLGLMPHPEHAVDPLAGTIDGLKIFRGPARSAGVEEMAGVPRG
jgi:phosphoribosylformylglycinamidine synthase